MKKQKKRAWCVVPGWAVVSCATLQKGGACEMGNRQCKNRVLSVKKPVAK